MSMEYRIDVKGVILNGKYRNWSILIQNDSESTGGYLILINNKDVGFDDWVKNKDDISKYLHESEMEIKWD